MCLSKLDLSKKVIKESPDISRTKAVDNLMSRIGEVAISEISKQGKNWKDVELTGKFERVVNVSPDVDRDKVKKRDMYFANASIILNNRSITLLHKQELETFQLNFLHANELNELAEKHSKELTTNDTAAIRDVQEQELSTLKERQDNERIRLGLSHIRELEKLNLQNTSFEEWTGSLDKNMSKDSNEKLIFYEALIDNPKNLSMFVGLSEEKLFYHLEKVPSLEKLDSLWNEVITEMDLAIENLNKDKLMISESLMNTNSYYPDSFYLSKYLDFDDSNITRTPDIARSLVLDESYSVNKKEIESDVIHSLGYKQIDTLQELIDASKRIETKCKDLRKKIDAINDHMASIGQSSELEILENDLNNLNKDIVIAVSLINWEVNKKIDEIRGLIDKEVISISHTRNTEIGAFDPEFVLIKDHPPVWTELELDKLEKEFKDFWMRKRDNNYNRLKELLNKETPGTSTHDFYSKELERLEYEYDKVYKSFKEISLYFTEEKNWNKFLKGLEEHTNKMINEITAERNNYVESLRKTLSNDYAKRNNIDVKGLTEVQSKELDRKALIEYIGKMNIPEKDIQYLNNKELAELAVDYILIDLSNQIRESAIDLVKAKNGHPIDFYNLLVEVISNYLPKDNIIHDKTPTLIDDQGRVQSIKLLQGIGKAAIPFPEQFAMVPEYLTNIFGSKRVREKNFLDWRTAHQL